MTMPEDKDNNWIWFVVPFLLAVVAVVLFVMFTEPAPDSPFTYGQ